MSHKKHILIIAASPRRGGNSTVLALKAADGVAAGGGEVDLVSIGNMNIAPCNGCDACRSDPKKGCVIEDDMQPLYPKIKKADGVIFATPVYWFNVSAQMKSFIDRSYAIHGNENWAFTAKDVGVILTYGDSDVFASGGINAIRSFQDICAYVRANFIGAVYGTADKPGDVKANGELMEKAFALGKQISGS